MARAAEPRVDRRAEIAKALYACMSKRGYANTRLKDIADAAGMTPSHVGYYFDDQAAILEYYATQLCERIVGSFPELDGADPGQLADAIARFCFSEGQLNTAFLGVIQELSGLAVHDARLHQIKREHAAAWRTYLEKFFELARPRNGLSPREAAWLAHAMLVGFDTNTLFDRGLSRETAHELFRRELRALAGVPDAKRKRGSR